MKPSRAPRESKADRILAVVSAARDVPAGVRYDLDLVDGVERVPAILLLPHAHAPVPAALLLHGFGSRKERMADSVGEALVRRGMAALAVDLPLHGERAGSPADWSNTNPMRLISSWRAAVREARLAIDYLASHDAVDAERLGIVGYSLGSFLANVVAAELPNVRAMVLAASGDLPDALPFASVVRAVVDPLRAARAVVGRPLLMINGRFDRTVTPVQAERLFAAAPEPKTMRWYGGGHWPPQREIEFGAQWLNGQLNDNGNYSRES
jgi:fermentation-respiration switch protein FrsA (DUF1100 family)